MINITGVEDLEKIGKDPGFPLNGRYLQTCDIDAHNLTESIDVFEGDYNGAGKTLSHLKIPLFNTINTQGVLCNIKIADSAVRVSGNVKYCGFLGGVAKECRYENITFKNCSISSNGKYGSTGLLVGYFNKGDIKDLTIESSHLVSESLGSEIGLCVGIAMDVKMKNITLSDSTVLNLAALSHSGLIIGEQHESNGHIQDVVVRNCSIVTKGEKSCAGLISGVVNGKDTTKKVAYVRGLEVKDCKVETMGLGSSAGIVSGELRGDLANIHILDSVVKTTGQSAHAGLVVGEGGGAYENLTLHNNILSTQGTNAQAGVVVGLTKDVASFHHINYQNNTVFVKGSLDFPETKKTPTQKSISPFIPVTAPVPITFSEYWGGLSMMNAMGIGFTVATLVFLGTLGCISSAQPSQKRPLSNIKNQLKQRKTEDVKNKDTIGLYVSKWLMKEDERR